MVQPAKSIFFNFGGPGEPCRPTLLRGRHVLQRLTNDDYDLITFDPRGTSNTIPFSCANDDLEAQAMVQAFNVAANASDTQLGLSWANAEVAQFDCLTKSGDYGAFIGTEYVAQDLMRVVDALGDDGMLRYWGLSYGTVLGVTVAAMFPDRIDKLILDGVSNPHEWYNSLAAFERPTAGDKVFSAIFTTCIEAGQAYCSLSTLNVTAAELERRFWDMLEELKRTPVVIRARIIDYSYLKHRAMSAVYNNKVWAAFTDLLHAMFTNDKLSITDQLFHHEEPDSNKTLQEGATQQSSLFGIHCGDRLPRSHDLGEMTSVYDRLTSISRLFGDSLINLEMICARWPFHAKKQYRGDFQIPNIAPALLIGNTGDAITPLVSAYNVSSGLEGSVVLEVDGYGHSSLSVPSACVLKHVSRFWLDGTLPEKNTRCEVEAKPYRNVTWAKDFGWVDEASG